MAEYRDVHLFIATMEYRQLIRIHIKGKEQPIEWSPLIGEEQRIVNDIKEALKYERTYLDLFDDDGAAFIRIEEIVAIEVIKDALLQVPATLGGVARLAVVGGISAQELHDAITRLEEKLCESETKELQP